MSIFHKSRPDSHKIFTAILVGTGVVLFWRGIWGLADIFLFPGNELFSHLMSVLIGMIVLYITHYLVKELM